ncbi:glycosyltransferase family 2 protein [Acidobacteriota bacterium]
MNTYVVLPAHNEEKVIGDVLNDLSRQDVNIIVVDDGSDDDTSRIVNDFFSTHPKINHLCTHPHNKGLGAALNTGIQTALKNDADIIITFDSDGQHASDDIPRIIEPILEGKAEVVIGKRDFRKMPIKKRFGNAVMNLLTWIFYGIRVPDSQCGLRALSRKASTAMELHKNDYGISSEIIREIARCRMKVKFVPIQTIYTSYSSAKGTGFQTGFAILADMFKDRFRSR